MAKMANMMKEQCKLTQELRCNTQPESSAQRENQIPVKANNMKIPIHVFQFDNKKVEGVLNKAQMKEVINIPKDREDGEIKKKIKQMEDTRRFMKWVG